MGGDRASRTVGGVVTARHVSSMVTMSVVTARQVSSVVTVRHDDVGGDSASRIVAFAVERNCRMFLFFIFFLSVVSVYSSVIGSSISVTGCASLIH